MAIFTREQARINLNGLIKKYEGLKYNKDFCKNESQIAESLIKPFVNVVLDLFKCSYSIRYRSKSTNSQYTL